MQGLEVILPEGFTGIVLRGDANGKASDDDGSWSTKKDSTKARTRGKRRAAVGTRKSAKAMEIEDDEECDVQVDQSIVAAHDAGDDDTVRTLTPTGQFSSFILWNPDIPVDEGRDEYLRSLTEWVSLAAEVCPQFLVVKSCDCTKSDENEQIHHIDD